MKSFGMVRLRQMLIWTLVGAATILLPSLIAYALGLRVNMTRSLPMGLYVVTKDISCSLIEFCPSGPAAEESRIRGYRNAGSCPDGAEPLIKPIVAREGDIVEMSVNGISVNGRLLKNTAPMAADRLARRLKPWKFGKYRVRVGELWVASTYNYGSYDSRYFGPILISSVRYRLRPIWTMHQWK
jgi:conjugative transfer signal peptidase TraF